MKMKPLTVCIKHEINDRNKHYKARITLMPLILKRIHSFSEVSFHYVFKGKLQDRLWCLFMFIERYIIILVVLWPLDVAMIDWEQCPHLASCIYKQVS